MVALCQIDVCRVQFREHWIRVRVCVCVCVGQLGIRHLLTAQQQARIRAYQLEEDWVITDLD